jgi:hypothetical protein
LNNRHLKLTPQLESLETDREVGVSLVLSPGQAATQFYRFAGGRVMLPIACAAVILTGY